MTSKTALEHARDLLSKAKRLDQFNNGAFNIVMGPHDYDEAMKLLDAEIARTDAQGWIKTTDRLPEKPNLKSYEYVDCLIYHKGEIKLRPWNCEHLCWDDEHYDDHYCDPLEPTHWMPLPPAPAKGNE